MKYLLTLLIVMGLGTASLIAQAKKGTYKMNSETSKSKSASKLYERGSTIKDVSLLTQLSNTNSKFYIAPYEHGYVYSEEKKKSNTQAADYSFYFVGVSGSRFDKPKTFALNAPKGLKPVAVSFSNDRLTMFATCLKPGPKTSYTIYQANKQNNVWSGWQELDIAKPFESAGFAVVNTAGNKMYLCAKSKIYKTGYDIYTSEYNDGWQKAILVQGDINSDGDDMFPTLFNDVLFYSSGAKGGEGGKDIIFVNLKDYSRECFNAGNKINTNAGEQMMILNEDNKSGLLIRNAPIATKAEVFRIVADDLFIK